jgi:V/A-type H+-transporting ATPase subunit A
MIREDFLQQNAFTDIDGYSSYDRQEKLLGMILSYDKLCRDAIAKGAKTAKLFAIPAREKIGRAKSVPADEYAAVYSQIASEMEQQMRTSPHREVKRDD